MKKQKRETTPNLEILRMAPTFALNEKQSG